MNLSQNLSDPQKMEYNMRKKSTVVAYLLWVFLGALGIPYLYLGCGSFCLARIAINILLVAGAGIGGAIGGPVIGTMIGTGIIAIIIIIIIEIITVTTIPPEQRDLRFSSVTAPPEETIRAPITEKDRIAVIIVIILSVIGAGIGGAIGGVIVAMMGAMVVTLLVDFVILKSEVVQYNMRLLKEITGQPSSE